MRLKELEANAKALASVLRPRLKAIDARLAALEAQSKALRTQQQKSLADDYTGTWRTDVKYKRGSLSTHKGSLWLSLADTEQAPGTNSDWRMVSKKDFNV